MDQQQINRVMDRMQHVCSGSGGRLTEKRERILELLLIAETPLSAYEIKDAYSEACAHIGSDEAHDAALFLICGECKASTEVAVPGAFINELSAVANDVGYTLSNTQHEIECLCDHCAT